MTILVTNDHSARLGDVGCEYCEGLTARSCLDVLALVVGNVRSSERIAIIEGAFAGGTDRCLGVDEAACGWPVAARRMTVSAGEERCEELMVSTTSRERLGRLRTACAGGLLPLVTEVDLVNASTALGGWSIGTGGFEAVRCAACESARCGDAARSAYPGLTAAVLLGIEAPFAEAAFAAACTAIERDGPSAFFGDDSGAPLSKVCTACDDESSCPADLRAALDDAGLEARLAVLEVALAGSDRCDGATAIACADDLETLLFDSFDVS